MARVAIVFTGGTIATRPSAEAGGNVPVLDGAAILALAPNVARIADIEVVDWGMVPASHLRFSQMLSVARTVDELLRRPDIDGAVIVQGTDVMEETSFAYDLLLATDKPIVVTGAMRDSSAPDYDGSRNLADAVLCASSPEMRGSGAMVVLNGTVICADVVVKRDTLALDTFQPREGQPLARIVDGRIVPVAARREVRSAGNPRERGRGRLSLDCCRGRRWVACARHRAVAAAWAGRRRDRVRQHASRPIGRGGGTCG